MAFKNNTEASKEYINNDDKVNITIPFTFLKLMVRYTFTERVTTRGRKNLFKLINMINVDTSYSEEQQNEKFYFNFIKESLNLILIKKIEDIEIIYQYLLTEVDEMIVPNIKVEEIFDLIEIGELTNSELDLIVSYIEENINYSTVFNKMDIISDLLFKIKSGSNGLSNTMNEFSEEVSDLYHSFNRLKNDNTQNLSQFNLSDPKAADILEETINKINSPGNRLLSPYQSLNEMIGGGFQKGKCYLMFGLPKHFKSGLLLNLALGMCRVNHDFELKDPTKEPVIYYFTQENSIIETIERIFSYCSGDLDLKNQTGSSALKLFNDFIKEATGISFKLVYKPNKSVNTGYLYELMDQALEEDQEIICMIQDYTKRIRSMDSNPDLRIELGEVVNDFVVFAKQTDIPLISAGQLNREATRVMEQMTSLNQTDIGKHLNASHIGESALMVENTDVGIIINRETLKDLNSEDVSNDKDFLSFKLIAFRGKPEESKLDYFSQPFCDDNGFRLAEDINLDEPVSVKNIGSELENYASPEVIKERFNAINRSISNNTVNPKIKRNTNSGKTVISEDRNSSENFLDLI